MHANPPELEGELIASELVPAESIRGDDEEDTTLLKEMLQEARLYISSFSWCQAILDSYFAGGVGGIFAIFFFHIRSGRTVDPWIWVAVGDVPSAYLPVTDCRSPSEFFRMYIRGMSKWVELARQGKTGTPEEGVPPVNVPATPEWAERLSQKLSGLTLAIGPFFENESDVVN